MSTYTELKFKRERAWQKYMTALQMGKPERECIEYLTEFELINSEWKREMRK